MSKINFDKAQNINVVAKRGDDFNLSLTITSEDGTSISFNNVLNIQEEVAQIVAELALENPDVGPGDVYPNGLTAEQFFNETLNNFHIKNPLRDVLLFTITDMSNKPVLIACSEHLDVAIPSSDVLAIGGAEALLSTISKEYASAVAKVVAGYAGQNNDEARNNYGTENILSNITVQEETLTTTNDDNLNSIFNANFEGYIAKGNITSKDGITQSIIFQNGDFKLQPGNYKYTFRQCNQLRKASSFSGFEDSKLFRSVKTYLVGKIKVSE